MGAAALAPRIALRRPRAQPRAAEAVGLAFDRPGGPLVAVCGIVGGAGTTTLALALAQQATAESNAPALLAEREDTGGALAALTGRAAPQGLHGLANAVAQGARPQHAFAELSDGTRLLAATTRGPTSEDTAIRSLLETARAAHGIVVIDAGSHHDPAAAPLAAASHIIWTTRADTAGIAAAQTLLHTPRPAPRQTLAVAATQPGAAVPRRALASLASDLGERIVLVPYTPTIRSGDPASACRALAGTLTALARTIAR